MSVWVANASGDIAVGDGLAGGNIEECSPDLFLEPSPVGCEVGPLLIRRAILEVAEPIEKGLPERAVDFGRGSEIVLETEFGEACLPDFDSK